MMSRKTPSDGVTVIMATVTVYLEQNGGHGECLANLRHHCLFHFTVALGDLPRLILIKPS